jgi:hypothetical protein
MDGYFGELLPGTVAVNDARGFRLGRISEANLPLCTMARDGEMRWVWDIPAMMVCNGATGVWESPGGDVAGTTQAIQIPIGNGTDVIGTGVYTDISMPTGGTFTKWRLVATKFTAGSTGSMVVDLWKDEYANYPPTVADTITGSDKPTLSADDENESTSLTGWTVLFEEGDTIRVNVDSASTITLATLILEYTPSSTTQAAIAIPIGDGLNEIPDGVWTDFSMPVSGTWVSWRLLATLPAGTGSLVVDLWSDAYGNYPPTVADTITAADKPTLSADDENESTTLTGWDTAFTAGDTIRVNVDSSSTLTLATLILTYTRTV